ncbi:MAG: LacI family transcriptional regulator [Sediminicola sp.]|jgi:LacI family transcriptional regulator
MAKGKKKITSKDIAMELGISRSVVSFVLNGKNKEMRISDELTKKVLELVETRNYQTNHIAKSLKTGKTHTIGLIVADIANPFFAEIASEIEKEVRKKGYSVFFCSSNENKKNFNFQLENFKNRQVDGLILIPPINSDKILTLLGSQNIPFVILDRVFENLSVNSVNINNHKAAYDATTRLINNGRKHIALINVNNELVTMGQRTIGYTDAVMDSGMKVNSELIKQLKFSNVAKDVNEAVKAVILNNADAVIFTTNKLGVQGIQAISNMEKRIPEDIAVISFDDTTAYAVAKTSITAIKQPLEQMCKEAVRILMKSIDKSESNIDTEQVILDASFIVRESCP